MKKLNEKYVLLLQKSYDKYKNLSVIDISNKDGNEVQVRGEISDGAKSLIDNKSITQKSTSKTRGSYTQKNKSEYRKQQVTHPMRKRFTAEEDKLLLPFIHNGERKDRKKLALLLNRDISSVRGRMKTLQRSSKQKKKKQPFSLTEDLTIVDAAVNFMTKSKSFEIPLPKFQAVATDLKRASRTVYKRWDRILMIWIRQYYHKTLNLEIRPILSNLIAEQYNNACDIDWKKVIQHSEFLGHTESSLSNIYLGNILPNAAKHFGKSRKQLTLKEVAEYSSEIYQSYRISEPNRIRQTQVISHFENLVKERKLSMRFQDM